MSRFAILVSTVAVAALSTACTSSESGRGPGPDDSTPSTSAKSTRAPEVAGPDCADVWKAGKTLPADYTECDAGTTQGRQVVTKCLDDTRLVLYNDALWGVTGGKVVGSDVFPVQDTEAYGAAYSTCTGE